MDSSEYNVSDLKREVLKLNMEWHAAHKMPKNASTEQRITWHLEHLKNCQCRNDIPEKLKLELERRGIKS